MAEEKYSPNDIPDLSADWAEDKADEQNRPYSGAAVQKLLKAELGLKFGGIAYEDGVLKLYDDAEHTVLLESVALTGTSYTIAHGCDTANSFYMLTGDKDKAMRFTPTTKAMELGQTEPEMYAEDYEISLAVDTGNGIFRDVTLKNTGIREGQTYELKIFDFVTIGANRLRVSIKGVKSEAVKTVVYTCTVTTLQLTSRFPWQTAWVEGAEPSVKGIFFEGNMKKTLHVRIDGEADYEKTFSAGERYSSTSYTLKGVALPEETGVHELEMWMEGEGIETQRYVYQFMVVRAADMTSAKLVCVNNVQTAVNYDSNAAVVQYAVYGTDTVTVSVTATEGDKVHVVRENDVVTGVEAQTVVDYALPLEIEAESGDEMRLMLTLAADGENAVEVSAPIDNSNSYIATKGYDWYFKAANQTNLSEARETFKNEADGSVLAITNEGMQWNSTDGYSLDGDGNRCFKVCAGGKAAVDIMPLAETAMKSRTIEFAYRVSNIADYGSPVMSWMTTDAYDADETVGVVVYPTRLVCLTAAQRSQQYQQVNMTEDSINHVALVFLVNYSGNGRNLCECYVNGVMNFVFEYTGGFGRGTFKMGQAASDVQLYMYRSYERALESNEVKDNFLNAIIETAERKRKAIREANDIMDGQSLTYSMARAKGYNCLIFETDEHLPDLQNNTGGIKGVNVVYQYGAHPEWNVKIEGIPMDGQGTTSSKYRRWNLRNKIKAANWYYGWDEEMQTYDSMEAGKDGYIAGYGLNAKVNKITHKKNIASGMQGHKIGATAFYNDLWQEIVGWEGVLPNDKCRVAVLQYPMLGFQKRSDGSYTFVGLYTSGADKKDKKTFGYGETGVCPNLMMIEGPNHAPLGTRFLCAWDETVAFDSDNETLTFGGEEGWDADIAADLGTDDPADNEAVLALYEQEFKPAYDAIFFCSPYVVTEDEAGKTVEGINADVKAWRGGTMRLMADAWEDDVQMSLLQVAKADGTLWAYSNAMGALKKVDGHDWRAYLGVDGSASGKEIRNARDAKFMTEVAKYVSLQEARLHWCVMMLIGATDNGAKNTYWRKFYSLADGGKWGFNQDDLDTILDRDNNGQGTKLYTVEPGDRQANGDEVFQGGTSAFWKHLEYADKDGLASMMKTIYSTMVKMATDRGYSGNTRERVYKIMSDYFWANSALYFPLSAYNEDTRWAYIDIWSEDPTATYNGVPPLTQACGDQYEGEKLWVMRRIDYIASKYHIGAFNGSAADGLGTIEFTPAQPFTFKVRPAIDIYPTISIGGADCKQGARTSAGEVCELVAESDGATTCYLKNVDLLSDVGDLSGLKMSSRGGGDDIAFVVKSKRLRRLKVGDAGTADVAKAGFNAASLAVTGDAMETVDARNVSSLRGNVDLSGCPRLMEAEFGGTNIARLMVGVGSKLEKIGLPASVSTVFLHSLNRLAASGLTMEGYGNVEMLYVNKCRGLNPVSLLHKIVSLNENSLQYLALVWDTEIKCTADELGTLSKVVTKLYDVQTGTGYGNVVYNAETNTLMPELAVPNVQGRMYVERAYTDDVEAIMKALPNLTLRVGDRYINFKDKAVMKVLLANGVGDGSGITESQMKAVTDIGTWFQGNAEVKEFPELEMMGVTSLSNDAFGNVPSLARLESSKITDIGKCCITNTAPYCVLFFPRFKEMAGTSTYYISYYDKFTYNRRPYTAVLLLPMIEVYGSAVCGLIDLGTSVREMGVGTVTDLERNIIARAVNPPSFAKEYNYPYNGRFTLFVPVVSVEAYQQDSHLVERTDGILPIGGEEWRALMKRYADERDKTISDFSLRYVDYDIFGVSYPVDELEGIGLVMDDQWLGKDGETYVCEEMKVWAEYTPENTRLEYFRLTCDNEGVSVKGLLNYARVLKLTEADGWEAEVTLTAASTQKKGVACVKKVKMARPNVTNLACSLENQRVKTVIEANTEREDLLPLTYELGEMDDYDTSIGLTDTGFVFPDGSPSSHYVGKVKVSCRGKSFPSSEFVAVATEEEVSAAIADDEVRNVLWENGCGDGKDVRSGKKVISSKTLAELTDIGTWFKGNTTVESFEELNQTGVKTLGYECFRNCKNLSSIDLSKVETLCGYCLHGTSLTEMDLSSVKDVQRYAFVYGFIPAHTLQTVRIASFLQWENKTVGLTAQSPWGDNDRCSQNNCKLIVGGVEFDGKYVPQSENLHQGIWSGAPFIKSVDLANVKSIGRWAFAFCMNLRDVYLPDAIIKNVDSSDRVFYRSGSNVLFWTSSEEARTAWVGDSSWPEITYANCHVIGTDLDD